MKQIAPLCTILPLLVLLTGCVPIESVATPDGTTVGWIAANTECDA